MLFLICTFNTEFNIKSTMLAKEFFSISHCPFPKNLWVYIINTYGFFCNKV